MRTNPHLPTASFKGSLIDNATALVEDYARNPFVMDIHDLQAGFILESDTGSYYRVKSVYDDKSFAVLQRLEGVPGDFHLPKEPFTITLARSVFRLHHGWRILGTSKLVESQHVATVCLLLGLIGIIVLLGVYLITEFVKP